MCPDIVIKAIRMIVKPVFKWKKKLSEIVYVTVFISFRQLFRLIKTKNMIDPYCTVKKIQGRSAGEIKICSPAVSEIPFCLLWNGILFSALHEDRPESCFFQKKQCRDCQQAALWKSRIFLQACLKNRQKNLKENLPCFSACSR